MRKLVFVLLVSGCAGSTVIEEEFPDADTMMMPGTDAGSCAVKCNGVCADTKTDNNNCGKCGTVCPMGATCVQGSCQCASGQTKCGDACVDTKVDVKHCGKCGTVCGGPDAGMITGGGTWGCANGVCAVVCPMGKTECNGECVDTKTDSNNCGMCGNPCGMGESCLGGLCCKMGETLCNNACTATQSDPMNCGMCGKQCPMNAPACVNGTCSQAIVYSKMFTGSQVPPAGHCTDWTTFRQTIPGNATSITIKGSNDNVGRTCTGATAGQIVTALKNGQTLNVMCNNVSWGVGNCVGGNDWGVSADGSNCSCTSKYAVRPCINHKDWGGVNSNTSCNAPSQTLTVEVK